MWGSKINRWHEQAVEQKWISFQKGPSHSACLGLRMGQSSETLRGKRCLIKVWLNERTSCHGSTVGTNSECHHLWDKEWEHSGSRAPPWFLSKSDGERWFLAMSHFLEYKMMEDFLTISFPRAQCSGKVQQCHSPLKTSKMKILSSSSKSLILLHCSELQKLNSS